MLKWHLNNRPLMLNNLGIDATKRNAQYKKL